MNTEPVYTYKTGEGWVPDSNHVHVITMACGTRVRLEARAPKRGEKYDCGGAGPHWGTQDNPNWEKWEIWFSTRKGGYPRWITAQTNRALNRSDVYIVAVPLEH